MTPTIITILIAAGALILSVFAASWLNVRSLERFIDARHDALRAEMDSRFAQLDSRFKGLEGRLDTISVRLDHLETRVDRIERQLEAIFKPIISRTGN